VFTFLPHILCSCYFFSLPFLESSVNLYTFHYCHLKPEGESLFLWNVHIFWWVYMAPKPKPTSSWPLWTPQILHRSGVVVTKLK
jgi:hypothetical protein